MDETTTTELLIVKAGDDYIRFTKGGYERCTMNKGSVFPLSGLDEVKKKCMDLSAEISNLRLVKLTIHEESFVE